MWHEVIAMRAGFVYLDEAVPDILWDAKYCGYDNFTGAPVDGYAANRVVGPIELAKALKAVQRRAHAHGCELLLWDAYRPQRAVEAFLRWANAPEDNRTKARHYPRIERAQMIARGYVAARSGHSRGAAVDLTLVDRASGAPLDMGGHFDLMDAQSHHGAENISPGAAQNRGLLRTLMEECGFEPYDREWWHYRLAREPYPDTYFDFPIE